MTAARLCLSRALHLPPQVCASASLLTQYTVHAACLLVQDIWTGQIYTTCA